ncbi:hypothetical protein PanWU01x14_238240 [Parasponia andersonii]|uniref:Uncharacterized protein n=1 Tax=Parasponia andersonii TaxID=3476 RepID=A0A2P5BHN1_PARAD|nr:hypothetical protein PanWU01x14_238240 [Parasponia andersonii]
MEDSAQSSRYSRVLRSIPKSRLFDLRSQSSSWVVTQLQVSKLPSGLVARLQVSEFSSDLTACSRVSDLEL